MITVRRLTKRFRLYRGPRERLTAWLSGRQHYREVTALDQVSFDLADGRILGVIGENGAGKSTLLRVLAGALIPEHGTVSVNGRVGGLLECGLGFCAEMTGRENIPFTGMLCGIDRRVLVQDEAAIIAFAELGEALDKPLRSYSNGMIMRLAFSIATHAPGRIFLIDETLAVGDAYFQQKCIARIREMAAGGTTVLVATHDTSLVKLLCDRAILLEQGRIILEGTPEEVVNRYHYLLACKKQAFPGMRVAGTHSYGNFKVTIEKVSLLDAGGKETDAFVSGDVLRVIVRVRAEEPVDQVTVGILLRDRLGQDVYGSNTCHAGRVLALVRGQSAEVEFFIGSLSLAAGAYTLTVAAHRDKEHLDECYQWHDAICAFTVMASANYFGGMVDLGADIRVRTVHPAAMHSEVRYGA